VILLGFVCPSVSKEVGAVGVLLYSCSAPTEVLWDWFLLAKSKFMYGGILLADSDTGDAVPVVPVDPLIVWV
jgi:hypothetical protein